jgi:hypothetical protein
MNRRTTLTLTTMALLCFAVALPAGDAGAQQKSLKDQLVGTWTLVSVEDINPDGTKKQYLGTNPRGILMFDAGGRYAQMLGRSDRPKLKGSRAEATAEEFQAAVGTFIANFGTWSINEADKILTRRREGALIPNAEGTEIGADQTCLPSRSIGSCREIISLAGDELKITEPAIAGKPPSQGAITEHEAAITEWVYRRAK